MIQREKHAEVFGSKTEMIRTVIHQESKNRRFCDWSEFQQSGVDYITTFSCDGHKFIQIFIINDLPV
jgi:hypothetical protein